MATIRFQTGEDLDLELLGDFFKRYLHCFPDAKLNVPGLYLYHPAADGGKNVFCAMDEAGQVMGFAPVFPAPREVPSNLDDPHHLWTIVIADPQLPEADAIRQGLLERARQKAQALAAAFPEGPVRLAADMIVSQTADIEFLKANGFSRYTGMFVMERSSEVPIPAIPLPAGLTSRPWRMPTLADQQMYVAAFNRCFPDLPKTLEALQFFLNSPVWETGTAFSAFDAQEQLIASILVYQDPAVGCGVLDDVFVLPEYRGQDIAKHLIAAGLQYLRQLDHKKVRLEVLCENKPAVAAYQALGFRQVNEEVLLGAWLERASNTESI